MTATIRIPAQDAYSPERQRYFDDMMTFRPGHFLASHRPLGPVMRARLQVYKALSDFRHRLSNVQTKNPGDVDTIPA